MANIKSAIKRARQNAKRREHNVSLSSNMRTAIKKVRRAIDKGDKKVALEAFKAAVPTIDSMKSKGLIHINKAARIKSRLSARIKKQLAS